MKYRLAISVLFIVAWKIELPAQTLDQQVNLFTIPNMSTSFVRMPSRESSQEIDGVFFNPAGLIGLDNGFHLQINNQFQFIRKGMTSEYDAFNDQSSYYAFDVNNFTFPTLFAVWKQQKLAFSLGVYSAVGGGGGASFDNLPSAELPLADMNNLLSGILKIYDDFYGFEQSYSDIDYRYDFVSKGLAFSPGIQLSASYKVSENFAVSGGVRYVTFFSNAKGAASNIEVSNEAMNMSLSPADYLRYMQANEQEVIGERNLNLGLISIDGNELLILMADAFEELIPDTEIDIRQNGKGFTPILAVQYNWKRKLFAVFKYEHRTKIELKTQVFNNKDGDGLYEHGKVIRSDLPGFMSLGLRLKVTDKLTLASGHRTIFFKRANWNGRSRYVDRNFLEFTISSEYAIHPKISVSGGYTYSEAKVDDEYQNEVDYVLPGHTFAFGAIFFINDNISLEAGLLNTIYTQKTYKKIYEPFQGRLDLPDYFNQVVHNQVDGRVMLVSIGANISMSGPGD